MKLGGLYGSVVNSLNSLTVLHSFDLLYMLQICYFNWT